MDALLTALRTENPSWAALTQADLAQMIAWSDKKRHELASDCIRALYGHSTPQRLMRAPAEPPAILYHGTAPELVDRIMTEGLKPMSRHYVHLSPDLAVAEQVGRRKAKAPTILRVMAGAAHAAGIPFYNGKDLVWLADAVPPRFIAPPAP